MRYRISIIRKIQRAISLYKNLGLLSFARRIVQRIKRVIGRGDSDYERWLAQKLATDSIFDAKNNTQTGGVEHIFSFHIIGNNARHGLSHIASDPNDFVAMLNSLRINYGEFTFVDLGSGKGRAVMLAAEFPFRRVVGVEFARELHEGAQTNVEAIKKRLKAPIELVCGDAAAYNFPAEPLLIYLFNPFEGAIIRQVSMNAIASWKKNPRTIRILYMNPVHISHFLTTGWQLQNSPGPYADLIPSITD